FHFEGEYPPAPATLNPAADPSEDLFDPVNRSAGANLPGAQGEQPVQKGIFRVGSFEARQRPNIGSSWRRVIADAHERHVNEGAVVGLQRDAQVELENAVCAFDHPIVAAGEHLAAQPVTVKRYSVDGQGETGI